MHTPIIAVLLALIVYQPLIAVEPAAAKAKAGSEVRDIADTLEPILKEHSLPALAAAAVKNNKTVAAGAVGVRRFGRKEQVTVDDRFHIGSNTKAMTATLCAILVHEGKLKWDSTIGEVFGSQFKRMAPEYRAVTLEQLLTHRSGLPDDRAPDAVIWPKVLKLSGPLMSQRRRLMDLVLREKPTAAPGAKYQYSNDGYTIAGAMCERVTGKSWESLMREKLFKPLGMTTAGFGPPGSAKSVDQPQGHLQPLGVWQAIPKSKMADNPAVIGPAGTVHCSLPDWAKFAAMHLRGAKGKEPLLPAESFRKLHTAAGDNYACGWLVAERGWAGGKALSHSGSNTMWYAVIWLAPQREMAFLAATNAGSESAFKACDAAVSQLIQTADSL